MSAKIRLAEGGGGSATARLIQQVFWSRFNHPELVKGNDAATLNVTNGRLAMTTDGFVVTPWKFPGGDIGKLAICGTINDLTMVGAQPLGLTVAFIIEEGFLVEDLEQIAQSMADTANAAGVPVIAGDTKVVNKGAADGVFITTTGIGSIPAGVVLGGELAQPGDRVIITGTMGDHGATIVMARGELGLSSKLCSDVAALNHLLLPLTQKYPTQLRVLRDPTRGGLATTLNEIATQSQVSIRLSGSDIPIQTEVSGMCELLGLDPYYLANEGKAILIAGPDAAEAILAELRQTFLGANAAIVGVVEDTHPGLVSIRNSNGGERILPLGSGEQLPRIC